MERLMIQSVNIPDKEKATAFRPGAIASVGDFFTSTRHRALAALFFCLYPSTDQNRFGAISYPCKMILGLVIT